MHLYPKLGSRGYLWGPVDIMWLCLCLSGSLYLYFKEWPILACIACGLYNIFIYLYIYMININTCIVTLKPHTEKLFCINFQFEGPKLRNIVSPTEGPLLGPVNIMCQSVYLSCDTHFFGDDFCSQLNLDSPKL